MEHEPGQLGVHGALGRHFPVKCAQAGPDRVTARQAAREGHSLKSTGAPYTGSRPASSVRAGSRHAVRRARAYWQTPVRLHHIVLDARDLPGLARFWTQALGWKILSEREREIVIGTDENAPVGMCFMRPPIRRRSRTACTST